MSEHPHVYIGALRSAARKVSESDPCLGYSIEKAADEMEKIRAENARLRLTLTHYNKKARHPFDSAEFV